MTKRKIPRSRAAESANPDPEPPGDEDGEPDQVLWKSPVNQADAEETRMWAGLVPPTFVRAKWESRDTESRESVEYKWMADPGHLPVQRALIGAGVREEDWIAMDEEGRAAMSAGASVICRLQVALRYGSGRTKPRAAMGAAARNAALRFLKVVADKAAWIDTSQKQPGYALDRARVAGEYAHERRLLIETLKAHRGQVVAFRNPVSLKTSANSIADRINDRLVKVLGHTLLQVDVGHVLSLHSRTPTAVATEILKGGGRFPDGSHRH